MMIIQKGGKMGRLIDSDHLKETLDYYIREAGWGEEINKALGWVRNEFIDSEPTAQPEIIRCKDCKNAEERGCALFCGFWTRYTAHKGYCFKEERRTDE